MPNYLLIFFNYAHLPEHLQAISKPINELAKFLDTHLPDGSEKTTGLRKLLEAKDCFVREAVGMPNKLKNSIAGDISDGYHTFNELYAHRMQLFAYICHANQSHAWKSKHHHPEDGPMYKDYFVVGIDTPEGQFSYHYHLDHWDFFDQVKELKHAPKFDGHTSNHVSRVHSLDSNQMTTEMNVDRLPNITNDQDCSMNIQPLQLNQHITSGIFMNFGEALEALKRGLKLARSGWNGKDMWIAIVKPYNEAIQSVGTPCFSYRAFELPEGANGKTEKSPKLLPYIAIKTVTDELVPWHGSQADLLANDWMVVA